MKQEENVSNSALIKGYICSMRVPRGGYRLWSQPLLWKYEISVPTEMCWFLTYRALKNGSPLLISGNEGFKHVKAKKKNNFKLQVQEFNFKMSPVLSAACTEGFLQAFLYPSIQAEASLPPGDAGQGGCQRLVITHTTISGALLLPFEPCLCFFHPPKRLWADFWRGSNIHSTQLSFLEI